MVIYRIFSSLVLVAFLFSLASAQSPASPPKETTKLYKLEGYWMGNTSIEAGTDKENVPYHIEFTKVLDGWGMSYREYVNSKFLGNYSGVGYLGFDPHDGYYHWHTLSNAGDSHDHIGTWPDENTFVLERTGYTVKEIYNEKLRVHFTSPTEMVVDFDLYINQDKAVHMSGTFKKSNGSFPMAKAK
jgi:hypothetical protein